MNRLNIAIDGPAGAGKSTIAGIIAKRLNILHLDTGAMYRAAAWKVIKEGISFTYADKIINMMKNTHIKIIYDSNKQRVIVDNTDVTDYIRTKEVTKGASDIAVIPEVRLQLVDIQREIAKEYDLVMDGRDVGTYVLPKAAKKFFLTATLEERAKRRYLEMKEKGHNPKLSHVKTEIMKRDENDSNRKFAPLKTAEDAVLIDTTGKTIEQVTDEIIGYIN